MKYHRYVLFKKRIIEEEVYIISQNTKNDEIGIINENLGRGPKKAK